MAPTIPSRWRRSGSACHIRDRGSLTTQGRNTARPECCTSASRPSWPPLTTLDIEAAGTEKVSSGFTGSVPVLRLSASGRSKRHFFRWYPGQRTSAPTASTTTTPVELVRAAGQRTSSFSGDDRPQYEAEDHRGTGSDRDTGHHLGEENLDCDAEDCCGRDRQRDIGGSRPRIGDRTSPFATVEDVLTGIITRRLKWKSDPRCSIGKATYRPTAASTIGKRLSRLG